MIDALLLALASDACARRRTRDGGGAGSGCRRRRARGRTPGRRPRPRQSHDAGHRRDRRSPGSPSARRCRATRSPRRQSALERGRPLRGGRRPQALSLDRHADEVVLVILVAERPHPMELPPPPVLTPLRRLRDGLMFMPILSYTDGYGLSYGARFTFADVLGKRGRIGVPLTWGGERRAAVELERKFKRGPVSRSKAASASSAASTRSSTCRSPRGAVGARRAGAAAGAARRRRRALDRRLVRRAVDAGVRSRRSAPRVRRRRDARHAHRSDVSPQRRLRARGVGAPRLRARPGAQPADARRARLPRAGRLVGAGAAATHGRADGPLPPYEQWLLGGPSSVRGYRAGSDAGDRIVVGIDRAAAAVLVAAASGQDRRRRVRRSRGGVERTGAAGRRRLEAATAPACSPSRRCSSCASTSRTARAAAPAPTSAPACRSERDGRGPRTPRRRTSRRTSASRGCPARCRTGST